MTTFRRSNFAFALLYATALPLSGQISEAFDVLIAPAILDEDDDNFGSRIVAGDIQGDGTQDIAVFGYNRTGEQSPGAVVVVRGEIPHSAGSPDYLEGTGNERFGEGLAFGDFDGDGRDELAVGRPGRTVNTFVQAGDLLIMRPAAGGGGVWDTLSTWSQASPGVPDATETDDQFGSELAVGDFNDDGIDDLAIGLPTEDVGAIANAGAVQILDGFDGVGLVSGLFFDPSTEGVPGAAETDDRFGATLAAGDVTCDGIDDLVIGVPNEAVGATLKAGSVVVLPGSASGLTTTGSFQILQAAFGGVSEENDRFGLTLAVGRADLLPDGCATLLIGAPYEDIGDTADAGAVFRWRAGAQGYWDQDDLGETPEAFDIFGSALAIADFDGDGRGDAAVGAPGEDIAGAPFSGLVHLIHHAGTDAFDLAGSKALWLRTGVTAFDTAPQNFYEYEFFGAALATPDLNADGLADLAVGIPLADIGPANLNGAINIFFSALFAEDFEGNDVAEWSDTTP